MFTGEKSKVRGVLGFVAVLGLLAVVAPLLLGLGKTGFEFQSVVLQFAVYSVLSIMSLIVLLVLFFAENNYAVPGEEKYGTSIAFFTPGEFPPSAPFKLWNTQTKVFLFFSILSALVAIYATYSGTSFSGIGLLGQQFSPFDNLWYNATLVVIAENLGDAALMALAIFGIRTLARKYNMPRWLFIALVYIIVPFISLGYGLTLHQLRYGDSEVALSNVRWFWYTGGLITLMVGSFVPFALLHSESNTILGLRKLFSNTTIYAYILGVIVLLTLVYALLFRKKKGVPT